MKRNLLLFTLLLCSVAPSRAEVLIYKGKGSLVAPPGVPLPSKFDTYFVMDVAGKKLGITLFFKANGQKTYAPGTPLDIGFTTSPVAGGGTARIIAGGSSSSTPPNFDQRTDFFRGIQKNLVVATGAVDSTRNEPPIIKGLIVQGSENSGTGSFIDARFQLFYEQGLTVAANNAGRTIAETLTDLVAKLEGQGYTALGP